ncbi:hypothetical protein GCM10010275_48890 [Streptomyces litmocidini]|nr:hypothetical protein GCM10010275_48890 [Streptomyces litmocidini]
MPAVQQAGPRLDEEAGRRTAASEGIVPIGVLLMSCVVCGRGTTVSSPLRSLEPRHLRRKGTCEVLVTEPLGYALRVPPESRDTVRFERALARAHRFMDQGRPERVVEEARNALEMWRGPAFADAAHHLFAVNEAARLEEPRQATREIRAIALLLRGRIVEALCPGTPSGRARTRDDGGELRWSARPPRRPDGEGAPGGTVIDSGTAFTAARPSPPAASGVRGRRPVTDER